MIKLGIDEVGRGVWAGPLVVGAVVLGDVKIDGLADSKVLTARRREELSEVIWEEAASVGLGWVSASEVDEVGLSEALRLATRRAVEEIDATYHEIVIDGTVNFLRGTKLEKYVTCLRRADQSIAAVSAAAIVAKVARDRYMCGVAEKFPGYGFERNVGYGTRGHREALVGLGVCEEHRRSVRPVREIIDGSSQLDNSATRSSSLSSQVSRTNSSPSCGVAAESSNGKPQSILPLTKEIGDRAEGVVCEYLLGLGYEVVARNWRTRWCEIDVVAELDGVRYFVEVKYRKSTECGGGLGAITAEKLERMGRAAEMYIDREGFKGEVRLAVGVVEGDFEVVDFIVL
ncbi:ribonuclease HII [Candidatus Saccharibacteria bacterium]|nr:ribonuclease HII [Candidatus Saccharibacteria bacterium]